MCPGFYKYFVGVATPKFLAAAFEDPGPWADRRSWRFARVAVFERRFFWAAVREVPASTESIEYSNCACCTLLFCFLRDLYRFTISFSKQSFWIEGEGVKEKSARSISWRMYNGPTEVPDCRVLVFGL